MEQQDNIMLFTVEDEPDVEHAWFMSNKDKPHDEFLKGFEEGYARAVDKATKWLNENAEKYVWLFEGDGGLDDNFENDFREAMRYVFK